METLKSGNYFGSTIKRKSFNGIVLTEKIHTPGEIIPLHAHENTYICTILQGNWEKNLNRRVISCSPLKSIYHQPNEEHTDNFLQRSHVFDIEIDKIWQEFLKNYYKSFSASNEYNNDKINWLSTKIFYEFNNWQDNSDLIYEERITGLIGAIARHDPSFKKESVVPIWLRKVKEIIEADFNKPISFKALAMDVDVHPVHLSRTFKSFFNCGLGEYQRILRIKASCEKLINSDKPLTDVAVQAGFYDQSHFYRVFKNQTGLLPLSFRQIYKS